MNSKHWPWLIVVALLVLGAAAPIYVRFADFNVNQFGSGGNKVAIKSGVVLTNAFSDDVSATNRVAANYMEATNNLNVIGSATVNAQFVAQSTVQINGLVTVNAVCDLTGNVGVGGDLNVTGSKNFLINSPLDPSKLLRHASVEAPRADLLYRGTVTLTNGAAVMSVDTASRMTPGTFVALTKNATAFAWDLTGWEQVRATVVGGHIFIVCKNTNASNSVGWLVIAERNDPSYLNSAAVDDDGNLRVEETK
jgi:hypothetical protein